MASDHPVIFQLKTSSLLRIRLYFVYNLVSDEIWGFSVFPVASLVATGRGFEPEIIFKTFELKWAKGNSIKRYKKDEKIIINTVNEVKHKTRVVNDKYNGEVRKFLKIK